MSTLIPILLLIVQVCLLAGSAVAQSQSFSQATPPSSSISLPAVQTRTLPVQDNRTFLFEDEANYALAQQQGLIPPAQIARPQEVNFNLNNSGTWETLPDGSRIWRLRIVSPNATDTWLIYDQWRIVKPCELYVYNDDRSIVFGPYTSVDNWDGTNVTPIVTGEAVTLEYFVPAGQQDIGELSVMRVLHGYRHMFNREARERDALDAFGESMPCMININCFAQFQDEKNSVAMIIDPMGGACSGAMLNNTAQNGDPLFLTANHCLTGNQSNWLFYFNYESPNCSPTTDGFNWHRISNATLLMSHAPSDHALLRLSHPRPATNFIPRYEGWYRGVSAAQNSFGIHHPAADVKKGHEDYQPATSDDWNGQGPDTHWMTHIDNGMMEPGSSGSPMFNENSRVVGPLHGGSWDCDAGTVNDALYGKMSVAWEGDGTSSGRLRDWLDPTNSGLTTVNAMQPVGPPNDTCNQFSVPEISTLPYSTSGTTKWAVDNYSIGGCSNNTAPDVAYSLRLNCDYNVTVSLCGSSYDTRLYIVEYYWCAPNGTPATYCNDDFCGLQSQVSFTAHANTWYAIWVDGYGSASGDFVLNITGTANSYANQSCPGEAITEVPYSTILDTECSGDNFTPACQPNTRPWARRCCAISRW